MNNTAADVLAMQTFEEPSQPAKARTAIKADIVELKPDSRDRDSLYENFASELDAWARHALASNGFGGY